ncbi:hypothetical protein COCMIDRAFT_5660 [Bipolaris oryzae ATCC 44560]|uniref:Uncharacterized protein n=1 Tax=Bipolaris oryzae ATCC 44560 TaxID=930090 RepID=W6Z521_COCMI|nr:uncharacterized protein COCMIDRAFT_5660 [Bipolaris oryzae ATCC 44560]EUC45080.1 hypothetical protein COCMIDRAFT_5660 [Bipolaris oryzae ATCC 44560]
MTLVTCQGASKEEAGIVEGQSNGYGNYGTTSTQQQREQLVKKRGRGQVIQSVSPNDDDELLEWDDLCKGPPFFYSSRVIFGGQLTVYVYSALATRQWFILTKHRRATFSYQRSLRSVFQIHNETVNIWSHIWGTAGFLYAMGALGLYMRELDRHEQDELAVLIYFISVIACFFFSFVYHIFLDHSQSARIWTSRFDYLGIVVPLWGTTIASTNFGFRCEPDLRKTYSVFATGAGLACAVTTLHPSFTGIASKGFRTVTYLLLGLSSFLPIIHGLHLFGWQQMEQRMSLSYYLALGLCHSTGAITYASRVPERWYPKRYDLVGSSHQIMHVLVVCGAAAYGLGVLKAREHWKGFNCAGLQ